MPYPRAPYYVLVCVAVILIGFWPSYFAPWSTVPWQFHAHGIAAHTLQHAHLRRGLVARTGQAQINALAQRQA